MVCRAARCSSAPGRSSGRVTSVNAWWSWMSEVTIRLLSPPDARIWALAASNSVVGLSASIPAVSAS